MYRLSIVWLSYFSDSNATLSSTSPRHTLSFLTQEHAKLVPASGTLHLLFPQTRILFPRSLCSWLFLDYHIPAHPSPWNYPASSSLISLHGITALFPSWPTTIRNDLISLPLPLLKCKLHRDLVLFIIIVPRI